MKSFLSLRQVSKSYEIGEEAALEPISLTISKHERVGIVGQTGSGKSTLLRIIAGLIQPDVGSVTIEDNKVQGPDDKLIPGHPDIAYLSQHFELPKFISVFDHLDDPYLIAREEAEKIYAACQINHLLEKDTRALSGGEKQRVALAKLLLKSPKLLLLDEPFSNLDYLHKHIVKHVITDVENTLGTTVVLVAHDPVDVLSWAQRILVFRHGKLVQEADANTIYSQPVDTYVAGLFGPFSLIKPQSWRIPDEKAFKQLDNKLMVRPEHFAISEDGIKGSIASIRFNGGYDQLEIATEDETVLLNAPVGKFKINEKVAVSLRERF